VIQQWLSPIDPIENHETAMSAHQQGTSNWFVESKEFYDWQGANRSFLLLSGFRQWPR
jgi:hypothetical protein